MYYREFKDRILATLEDKVASSLESKRIEIAQAIFNKCKECDINESGSPIDIASAEVLKSFGNKLPSKPEDLLKLDSVIKSVSKKYKVRPDELISSIQKGKK